MSIAQNVRYDRQVRLWGHTTQKWLSCCCVAAVGLGSVTSEVVKNLCLAGVRAITLEDDSRVEADDYYNNILLQTGALGERKDAVCAKALDLLNPSVDIQTRPRETEKKAPEESVVHLLLVQMHPSIEAVVNYPFEKRIENDIVVIALSSALGTLALYVYGDAGATVREQLHALLEDPERLSAAPQPFQEFVLHMHLASCGALTNQLLLLKAASEAARMGLTQVDVADVLTARQQEGDEARRLPVSAVEASLVGATISQHVMYMAQSWSQSSAERLRWSLYRRGGEAKVLVGGWGKV